MYDLTNFTVFVFPSVVLFVNSQPHSSENDTYVAADAPAPWRFFISLPSTRGMCQLIAVLWKHVMGKRSSQQFMWHNIMNINIGKTWKTHLSCFCLPYFKFSIFNLYSVDCMASCELKRYQEGFINIMLFICRFKYKNYSHN